MKLGIGIDTGGTYTDAVVYDFESKRILGSAKALTTKNDLTVGILGAIDGLPPELAKRAEVVSLSTTLATNACVEDKGGRAKLIFFGGDPEIIRKYGGKYGLPSPEDIYIQESFTSFSGGSARELDWDLFRREIKKGFEGLDGVGIIEMNAARNGASNEKKAKEIFREQYDIPVVCGHELFSELNSLQRGASTLLNAGLFPVISEFLASVKKALAAREMYPDSIVIVRSDGSLMSEEFSSLRPVETLLCGPAASALGSAGLAGEKNSIVVDMGGTTTDIALIRDGVPVSVTGGVSIGRWKTFVNGLYVRTLGLGGDSAVHYSEQGLYLEEYRVVPLCVATKEYPSILEDLRSLSGRKHTKFLHEHYLLVRKIEDSDRYTPEEKAFCRALEARPLPLEEAAAAVGKDVYTLRVDRLLKDGVVQLCGFTPTDAMHLRGDFCAYEKEASLLGASFIGRSLDLSPEEVCAEVYDQVKRKLYVNVVKALLEHRYPDFVKKGISADVERFILESYEEAKSEKPDSLLSAVFRTEYTLVGVGAPIFVFLEDVASMLGTRAVIPENYQVANAFGAIIGSVSASCSVEIQPGLSPEGLVGYVVFGQKGKAFFEELEDAVEYAKGEAEQEARAQAKERGAIGTITVTTEVQGSEADIQGGTVDLGTVVSAHAVGTMGF